MLLSMVPLPAWGSSGEYVCSPGTPNGQWFRIESRVYDTPQGCVAWTGSGSQLDVKVDITDGSIHKYWRGVVYCDLYAGPNYEGKTPWSSCTTAAVGTPVEGPLPARVDGACPLWTDPYPEMTHHAYESGVVFMHTKYVDEYRCQCNLTINSLSGDKSAFSPSSGETLHISGSVSESYNNPLLWTVTVEGTSYTYSGSSPSIDLTWNGKTAEGRVVSPGTYTVTLRASVPNGGCSENRSFQVTVIPAAKNCSLNINN